MKDYIVQLGYTHNDNYYTNKDFCDYTIEATETSFKLTLLPKDKIELVNCNILFTYKYDSTEKVFANGYQSWSTSKEYGKNDIVKPFRRLTSLPIINSVASISGEYKFKKFTQEKGVFHSYTYTYIKRNLEVILFGSLSEDNGFTIFNHNYNTDTFGIEKDVDGLIIDSPIMILDIVKYKSTYDEVFDLYFKSFSKPKRKDVRLVGYTSWYNYFSKINEEIILRDLDGITKVGANIFQIDDGYQTAVGDFLSVDKVKFPRGMKFLADSIHNAGLKAGIWLAPFSVEKKSNLVKEHPEWLIRNPKTKKPVFGVFSWSGAYTLDILLPEVREHLKHLFSVVTKEWGFDMVKLDFLYSQSMIPRQGMSRGMIMSKAMEFLRECVGEDILILGCGVPLGSTFGVVDACRISCDVDTVFKERFWFKNINREIISAKNAINNTISRRHLSGRAFANDPDVFFLRETNLQFSDSQKLLLASVNNMFGDILFISDNVGDYKDNQLNLLKNTFSKRDLKIEDVSRDQDIYTVKYTEKGEDKVFSVDLNLK